MHSVAVGVDDIVRAFNWTFSERFSIILSGGAPEPLYIPPYGEATGQLRFREDFAASALHEAAHWCIAGPQRRRQVDFGYQYTPPPRTAAQQQTFYKLELKTQSLEAEFAACAALPFRPSADDLTANPVEFGARITAYEPILKSWLRTAAGYRARLFCAALKALHD